MAKFVPDVKTQRWIVIAPARISRPDEHAEPGTVKVCHFCPGNEGNTPAEVMRVGDGDKDQQGWKIRVVPNLYPITDIHEVIIHSPNHKKDIAEFDTDKVALLLTVYRARYLAHVSDDLFKSWGASRSIPYSSAFTISCTTEANKSGCFGARTGHECG